MEVALVTTVTVFSLYLGYLTSVFSISVFVDPDQLDELAPQISPAQREFLEKMAHEHATFIQVATFYKWLSFLCLATLVYTVNGLLDFSSSELAALVFALSMALSLLLAFVILEALPRRRSLQKIDRKFLKLIPALRLAFAVSKLYLRLTRRFAARPEKSLSEDVKEEIVERAIESLADQVGVGEKLVDETERQMIERIFHLDNTTSAEIMSPRVDVIAAPVDISLTRLRRLAAEHGHSRYPVYRETLDSIVGVLYIKDIFIKPPANTEDFSITKYMREPYLVPADMHIDDLLSAFKKRKVHLAIVLDEFGGTAGIVTMEDVLEEIVGDIQDEHDEEQAEFVDLGDGAYEVDGGFPLEDLVERLGIDHDQSSFETVGGLLYDLVGSVPVAGEEIKWGEVTFVVTVLDGQRIERIRLRLRS